MFFSSMAYMPGHSTRSTGSCMPPVVVDSSWPRLRFSDGTSREIGSHSSPWTPRLNVGSTFRSRLFVMFHASRRSVTTVRSSESNFVRCSTGRRSWTRLVSSLVTSCIRLLECEACSSTRVARSIARMKDSFLLFVPASSSSSCSTPVASSMRYVDRKMYWSISVARMAKIAEMRMDFAARELDLGTGTRVLKRSMVVHA